MPVTWRSCRTGWRRRPWPRTALSCCSTWRASGSISSGPSDAPVTFVPKSWLPFVLSGEDKASRRFWELALLWRLRDRLRSGDVWVAGSRPYADPETYLLDRTTWDGVRPGYCQAVERPMAGDERVAQLSRDLGDELGSFASMLERGDGPVRLDGDRRVVGRDLDDDLPASASG